MAKQIAVTLSENVEEAVEEWRKSMPVPPSRSSAVAVLIAAGLKVLAPDLADKHGF